MRHLLIAAALLYGACGKKPASSDSGSADSARSGSSGSGTASTAPVRHDAASPASPLDASSGGGSMASDFKPFNAFRAHAAQVLQVKPEQLEGGADTEEAAQRMPHTVGGAWAYTNFVSADPPRDVRGWVTADATVITPTQNLGRLFVEAGVWTKTPSLTAGQLAEHLAWAYGMNHAVFIEPENGAPAPRLKLADDGSGTFRFFLDSKPAGPGGAGGGPADVCEVNVTLTPDHQATLTKTPFQLP